MAPALPARKSRREVRGALSVKVIRERSPPSAGGRAPNAAATSRVIGERGCCSHPPNASDLLFVGDHFWSRTPMSQLEPSALRARRAPARLAGVALAGTLAFMVGCSEEPVAPKPAGGSFFPKSPFAAVAAPPGASVQSTVVVPASMQSSPFNTARSLLIPPNFTISVYARIGGARFMAVTPDGNLLVSRPGSGSVSLVRPNGSGDPLITSYVTGLRRPHDIVFATIGGTTYVYITETNQINRYVYNAGALTPGARQVVITGLPDASSPELNGTYGHELKNIAIDGNNKLYVSIASTCNVCTSDTQSSPVRAAIYVYDADGTNGRLYARGLRNAEALAMIPGTNTLWAAVNNRDDIAYPFNDASGNYGRVYSGYVDNHPPEEFTRVRDGGNYGWPFCNPNPDAQSGLVDMPFDLDYQMNRTGTVDCTTMDRIDRGIQAHSAPLGLTFFQNTAAPDLYKQGAAIGLHGSWNRTQKTGYKIAYFPWDALTQLPGDQVDLVSGWADAFSNWGRPVDVAVDPSGAILISDDQAGAIYKLTYGAAPPPPPPNQTVASFTLINADNDQPIAGYDPIASGANINLATLATRNLNIRANTSPASVGSVRFRYDGTTAYSTDNASPYALGGDTGGNYVAWTPTVANHTLTATPYAGVDASGTAGTAKTLTFKVTDKRKGKP
jgi:glucose/arabinose dehydrogenase